MRWGRERKEEENRASAPRILLSGHELSATLLWHVCVNVLFVLMPLSSRAFDKSMAMILPWLCTATEVIGSSSDIVLERV